MTLSDSAAHTQVQCSAKSGWTVILLVPHYTEGETGADKNQLCKKGLLQTKVVWFESIMLLQSGKVTRSVFRDVAHLSEADAASVHGVQPAADVIFLQQSFLCVV